MTQPFVRAGSTSSTWFRSLYSRIAFGFVALLAALLLVQALSELIKEVHRFRTHAPAPASQPVDGV